MSISSLSTTPIGSAVESTSSPLEFDQDKAVKVVFGQLVQVNKLVELAALHGVKLHLLGTQIENLDGRNQRVIVAEES
jgi:hypothetical protein